MQVRIVTSGIYRRAFYHAGELADLPDVVAKQLIQRKLAAPPLAPPVTKSRRSYEPAKPNS